MKKYCFTLLVLFFISLSLHAQQDTIIYNEWVPTAAAGINLSQIALDNWTQGGEDALSWALLGNGSVYYRSLLWHFKNDLKLAYGRTKLGSADFRTTDNELYLESVVSRNIGWAIDPYFSNTVRTAIAAGYDYDADPPVEIANFFDPGYLTQSLGFLYDQVPGFTTRLGFALQEVITNKYVFYSDDTTTAEIEKFKFDTGIESVTTAEYTVMENILFKSKLRLFSRFDSFDVWDVRWDNAIVAQVNEYVNVSIAVLVVYEEAQIRRTQLKEAIQLGIIYNIL